MGIGTTIKELLHNKHKTVRWLSETTGISIHTLYSVTKRDSKTMSDEYVIRIAEALEVDTDVLTGNTIIQRKRLETINACMEQLTDHKYSFLTEDADSVLITDKNNNELSIIMERDEYERMYKRIQAFSGKLLQHCLKCKND